MLSQSSVSRIVVAGRFPADRGDLHHDNLFLLKKKKIENKKINE